MSEEIKLPTATEVENIMVEKEKESTGHVLDTYAGHFQIYSPIFDRHLEVLGKKSLIRVMKLLIKYPLEENHLKALNKVEKDLLKIGDQLLIDKYTMMIHYAAEQAIKEAEKQENKK